MWRQNWPFQKHTHQTDCQQLSPTPSQYLLLCNSSEFFLLAFFFFLFLLPVGENSLFYIWNNNNVRKKQIIQAFFRRDFSVTWTFPPKPWLFHGFWCNREEIFFCSLALAVQLMRWFVDYHSLSIYTYKDIKMIWYGMIWYDLIYYIAV